MKYLKIIFLLGVLVVMAFSNKRNVDVTMNLHPAMIDTMPVDICAVVTPQEIDAMNIFNNGAISKSYPEPDPVENFHACYYEFDRVPHRYGALGVQLMKAFSKEEAGNIFSEFKYDHHRIWGVNPETILHLADSACMTMNEGCADKCREAVLIVKQGFYVIWIQMKAPEGTLRDRLKTMAIKIVNMMYDRIPGLAPQYIRTKN